MEDHFIENLAWAALLLPLLAAVAITLGARRAAARLSIGAVTLSFLATLGLLLYLKLSGQTSLAQNSLPWLTIGHFGTPHYLQLSLGVQLDTLSLMMMLVVTGVGLLIHIYSQGYLAGDEGYSRFFACLSLFTFSMLGIVLADNFVMLFIFWELVGVSSYLLIGFWYNKASAADACKKAFLTNRIGDFGFLLGILLVWSTLGAIDFASLKLEINHGGHFAPVATMAGLLIFCGAVGKSAQFPLHVWLPDAMEGPTPVSALIHAATMVAAGVYMLCRVYFLLAAEGSHALEVIAWIGGGTSLLAALIAVQQNDIKRILAYSTLSQLGYMVMAVGTHGPTAAMYHLTTHAFFKALLFLGAGAVIYALHHEQDIWKMGGLRKQLPVTYWTFLVGTLALCGVVPFSGFYSKDSILAQTLKDGSYGLFTIGVVVAALTTFYMARLALVVFGGAARSAAAQHPHEAPPVMLWPLRILAVPSVIGGWIFIEATFAHFFAGAHGAVGHAAEAGGWGEQLLEPFNASPAAAFAGLFAIIVGGALAGGLYWNAATDPLPRRLGFLSRAMANRFYFDELYERVLIPCTHELLAKIAAFLDRWIIGGLAVRGSAGATEFAGRALRLVQSGSLQTYAFLLVGGVAVVIYFLLAR